MPVKIALCWLALLWLPAVSFAVVGEDAAKQPARQVTSGDIAGWGMSLLIVLGVFFLCIWGLRKLNGLTVNGTQKMRLLGGLSLGMREKVILLQVGKKQLILGVTPGRIETLLVLEGEDCLLRDEALSASGETGFTQKLMQALNNRPEPSRSGSPDA
jgi:flagellar protein FliO/FliZ